MLVILSIALCVFGAVLGEKESGTWVLFLSQLTLLASHICKGQVTGTGGFLFMSLLFFGVRPLYIVTEDDLALFHFLFLIDVDLRTINENMAAGTAGMIAFHCGSALVGAWQREKVLRRSVREAAVFTLVPSRMVQLVLIYQVASLPLMSVLAGAGRSLYASAAGAFAYDLPVPLQAGHIFGMVVILERYRQQRRSSDGLAFLASGALFLVFTWMMREVSMFRGFYIAGVMIAGIAVLQRVRPRVSYAWLILPIVLVQPLFQTLGEMRGLGNDEHRKTGLLDRAVAESPPTAYWDFYSSEGDMNIFDTFVAARGSEPAFRPYLRSWFYAPFHVVPRKFWASKPEGGVLQDLRFMNNAPYCPGIAGFLWLDGGSDVWMMLNLLFLGGIIGYLDGRILSMRDNYLRACLVGILVVNSMFLTRFFLWQALWQALYAAVPCFLLHRFLTPPEILAEEAEDTDGNLSQEEPGEAREGV